VSTILNSAGDQSGLLRWAAQCGGQGLMHALLRNLSDSNSPARLASPACLEWAKDMGVEGLNTVGALGRDFGTMVHTAAEGFLTGNTIPIGAEHGLAQRALQSFQEMHVAVGWKVLSVEQTVHFTGDTPGPYAGRYDALVHLDEEMCMKMKPFIARGYDAPFPGKYLMDIKTGNFYKKKCQAQMSAYQQAIDVDVMGAIIVNIPRDKPDNLKIYPLLEADMYAGDQLFHSAYDAWSNWDAPKWYFNQGKE
jgi:hypothetical protein